MRHPDMSMDLILEKESEKDQSFFSKIIRSVSRSIERMTEPKRINYDIEKINFSKFLTDEVFPKSKQLKLGKTGFYSEYEVNRIEAAKAEKLSMIEYLKNIKARGEVVNGSHDFSTFLLQKRRGIEKNINSIKQLSNFLRSNDKCIQQIQGKIEERRILTENLKFDKIKDFESRGRTLIKIKNIEVILQLINKMDLNVPAETKTQLIGYRTELIGVLRTTIELRKKLDHLRKQKVYEEEVALLKNFLGNLSVKR